MSLGLTSVPFRVVPPVRLVARRESDKLLDVWANFQHRVSVYRRGYVVGVLSARFFSVVFSALYDYCPSNVWPTGPFCSLSCWRACLWRRWGWLMCFPARQGCCVVLEGSVEHIMYCFRTYRNRWLVFDIGAWNGLVTLFFWKYILAF